MPASAPPMTCPACGTPNEPGRKFCGECGTRLAATCPSCGTANAPGRAVLRRVRHGPRRRRRRARRAPTATARPRPRPRPGPDAAPVAERRLVTVLFADLVGFTRSPRTATRRTSASSCRRYFELAREVVERYGGTVEKFIGDAVMAVWGAPTAHEDDAERAVRAALELVDAVPDARARASRRAPAC